MRVEEAWNLRAGCLHIERDPQFGDIYVLCGRTTKTMQDTQALWVTFPSAGVAVEAMRRIADLRAECSSLSDVGGEQAELFRRYLLDRNAEPWGTKFSKINRALRPPIPCYANAVRRVQCG